MSVSDGTSQTITSDVKASEPNWLGNGHDILWLKESENSNTSFVIGNADDPGKTYVAGTIPGPVGNIKLRTLGDGKIAVAMTGKASTDGSLYNPKDAPSSHTSAKLFDSLYVRHWDEYVGSQKNTIWTTLLQQAAPHVTERTGKYGLLGLTNVLKNTGLECPFDPPSSGASQFDMSSSGIVLAAKNPHVNPATHTKCETYFVPLKSFVELSPGEPRHLRVPGLNGAVTSPVFSPDGKNIVFLKMAQDGYEADRNVIVMFPDVTASGEHALLLREKDGSTSWDRSPSSVMWSANGKSLLISAPDVGRECLFSIPLTSSFTAAQGAPQKLTSTGSVIETVPASLGSSKLLVTQTSFIDSSIYSIIDPAKLTETTTISSLSNHGSLFGLSSKQVSDIWWKGAQDHPVHAWMIKPSHFKEDKKYPLCYLIHGGPQSAWMDQWSTRWNSAAFAEQGYVVVMPNPTGSTSYGQDFTDAIQTQWGGRPYEDLVAGFEHISSNIPFIDTSNAVAAGASFGGYMMNWIQGHPFGRKFKALVCHDGIFNTVGASLGSEEMYFPIHDLGGPPWEERELWDKWDPSRFIDNWATPELVIHNELDYRLTIAEGLGAFNVLQMRGVESQLLVFPDENHFVLQPENSLVWHHTVFSWINKYAGLPPVSRMDRGDGLPPRGGWKPPQDGLEKLTLKD